MTTKVEKTITVDVPVSTAYNQWTQFEEFPHFMGGVTSVEQLSDTRLHWMAEIAGVKRQWDATILEQRPDEKVAWAADEGATNAGAVYFAPAGAGQTLVRLELEFEPEGLVEKVGDETGAWRGDVGDLSVGTPTTEHVTEHVTEVETSVPVATTEVVEPVTVVETLEPIEDVHPATDAGHGQQGTI